MAYPESPYVLTDGIVYFARMCDKIRLHSAGKLDHDYVPNLGRAFDDLCCQFLGISYEELDRQIREGKSNDEALAWCARNGRELRPIDKKVWNAFMTKRAWRDDARPRLIQRLEEAGMPGRADIETMFDFIEIDEGREPKGPVS